MNNKSKISIIIPAFNEEGNIENTVNTVMEAMNDKFVEKEILIFDDASTDNTGITADKLATMNSYIKVIHNAKNMGIGYNFAKGISMAQYEYITMIPGDNEISMDSIKNMFKYVGQADIVSLYTINTGIRPFKRRIISRTFVILMNIIFGLKLRYYNGPCTFRTSLLRAIPLDTDSFAYMASILVRLIKSGATFIEVGMFIQPRKYGNSKALSFKNFLKVSRDILYLFNEIYFQARLRHNRGVRG